MYSSHLILKGFKVTFRVLVLCICNIYFSSSSFASNITVAENSGANQVAYTFDPAMYSVMSMDQGLSVDLVNGFIFVDDADFEIQENYFFEIANNSSLESEVISILILNQDEIAPVIVSSAVAELHEYSGSDQVVYVAVADDSFDVSWGVTYGLASSHSGLSIDPNTGYVALSENPVYVDTDKYNFTVIATDTVGNVSVPFAVELNILEALPHVPSVILNEDTGIDADNISSNGEVLVENIKPGASWEYSLDNGSTWTNGTGTTFTIPRDGTHQVKVKQSNSNPEPTVTDAVEIILDTAAPVVQFGSANSDVSLQTITVKYSEALDPASLPDAGDYVISQNGNPLTVSSVALDAEDNSMLVLSIQEAFNPGAMNFTYTASSDANELVTDLAGNQLDQGFTQMIVSAGAGYIRGAQVYIDANGDGIAQDSELREEVTSDEFGQIILTDEFLNAEENTDADGNPYQVIVKGGINVDSGAPNEIELTAPAGYSVINPLSTLVQEIASSLEVEFDTEGMSEEEAAEATQAAKDAAKLAAETSLAETLGISLEEVSSLGSYDPQSDTNIANRVVATQIATVLAVASSTETTGSESAETTALASLANTISSADGTVTLNSSTLGEVLDGVVEDSAALDAINLAVDAMEAVKNSDDSDAAFEAIVQAQAIAIDFIAPQAPQPEISINDDAFININNPVVRFVFDTSSTDGSAVIAGDLLVIFITGVSVGVVELTAQHIEDGYYDYIWVDELSDGNKFISANITDLAGNQSYVSTFVFEVVAASLEITSNATADAIDENSGEGQIIYTATTEASDFWKFELSEDSDLAFSINSMTGAVILSANPDFEVQSQYSFTVIAFDNAGNTADKTVTLNINNLDEASPTFTSGDTANAIDENSGSGQVVYLATADDSADISDGVIFSLTEGSAPALSIDAVTGYVTLSSNPSYEGISEYDFTVVVTDAAGNFSAKNLTLNVNPPKNYDFVSGITGEILNGVQMNQGQPSKEIISSFESQLAVNVGDVVDLLEASVGVGYLEDFASDINQDGRISSVDALTVLYYSVGLDLIDSLGHGVYFTPEWNFQQLYEDSTTASYAGYITGDVNGSWVPTNRILTISSSAKIFINEHIGANTVIYNIELNNDQTIPDNVIFSLSQDSDSEVTIDTQTGQVSLSTDPDKDIKSTYTFSVIAEKEDLRAEKQVTAHIVSNEDKEILPIPPILVSVDENIEADQQIFLAEHILSYEINQKEQGPIIQQFSLKEDGKIVVKLFFDLSLAEEFGNELEAAQFDFNYNSNLPGLNVANVNYPSNPFFGIENTNQYGQIRFSVLFMSDFMAGIMLGSESGPFNISSNIPIAEIEFDIDNPNAQSEFIVDQVLATNSGETKYFGGKSVSEIKPAQDPVSLSFSLGENTDPAISIDPVTGQVFLSRSLNYVEDSEFSFTVISEDSFGSISQQSVTLYVNNLDFTAPIITSGTTAIAIDENSGSGQVIYTATADDSADVSDGVSFSLVDDLDGALSIDTVSGVVTTDDFAADYEMATSQSFTVVATDAAGNVSAGQAVTLDINDVDEVAPIVTSGDMANAIDENSGSGQVVYLATADDSADVSDGVTFSLAAGSDAALSIDAASGAVTLIENPDSQIQAQYNFKVVATDVAGNVSLGQQVTLVINDLDEAITNSLQIVSVGNLPKGVLGQTVRLDIAYDTSDSNNQLAGLGTRIHFNSQLLTFNEVTDIVTQDLIVDAEGPFSDEDDHDNDSSTDQYISFGWASLYNNWPNTELSTVLMSIAFDVSDTIDTDSNSSTQINFSEISITSGYLFKADNYELELVSSTWDFDGNGHADALTDGLIMLRYCFQLKGEILIRDVMSPQSTMTAEQVEAALENARSIADIDNDGSVDALSDGLMLLRYLFGLRGDQITASAIGTNANRTSNVAVEAHLEAYMPAM